MKGIIFINSNIVNVSDGGELGEQIGRDEYCVVYAQMDNDMPAFYLSLENDQ